MKENFRHLFEVDRLPTESMKNAAVRDNVNRRTHEHREQWQ